MKTNRMTEAQIFWISAFADELAKRVNNFKDGDDICQKQILNVLQQIEKYIKRYPNPQDAAKAMSFTASINFGRDEAIQRGEGVRRNRIVDRLPTRRTEDSEEVAVDLIDRNAVDPATQAADRDECRRVVLKITSVVATGVALTAVFDLNQGEAATHMGIGRTGFSRMMKKSEREMRDGQQDAT